MVAYQFSIGNLLRLGAEFRRFGQLIDFGVYSVINRSHLDSAADMIIARF